MLGNHGPFSEMPFKWSFAGGSMMACIKWHLDPLSPHELNKNVVKVGPLCKNFHCLNINQLNTPEICIFVKDYFKPVHFVHHLDVSMFKVHDAAVSFLCLIYLFIFISCRMSK